MKKIIFICLIFTLVCCKSDKKVVNIDKYQADYSKKELYYKIDSLLSEIENYFFIEEDSVKFHQSFTDFKLLFNTQNNCNKYYFFEYYINKEDIVIISIINNFLILKMSEETQYYTNANFTSIVNLYEYYNEEDKNMDLLVWKRILCYQGDYSFLE